MAALSLPILTFNSGSSSLKFALYRVDGQAEHLILRGSVEGLGQTPGTVWAQTGEGAELERRRRPVPDSAAAVQAVWEILDRFGHPYPQAIGHRLVTAGPHHLDHQRVDAAFRTALVDAVAYAPLHVPAALALLDAAERHFPGVPAVACLDTAFHQTLPEIAARFPLPRQLFEQGIRRYGFHGLSCESIVRRLAADLPERLVVAHLGSGASLTAIYRGRSIDTTMGLTPTGGVVMGTRSGDLDPGVLIYLLTTGGYDVAGLEQLVNHQAGLLGLSGRTSAMESLLAAAASDAVAAQAVAAFAYSIRKAIAGLAAALGGLDTLVFTGGIGEHAPAVRAAIVSPLAFLGLSLDEAANQAGAPLISAPRAPVAVRVMPSQESRMIARHTWECLVAPAS